jgi:hypothetical protein
VGYSQECLILVHGAAKVSFPPCCRCFRPKFSLYATAANSRFVSILQGRKADIERPLGIDEITIWEFFLKKFAGRL